MITSPYVAEELLGDDGVSLVVVHDVTDVLADPGSLPVVVCAVGEALGADGPAEADLVVDVDRVPALVQSVEANPYAATCLAVLLRGSVELAVDDAGELSERVDKDRRHELAITSDSTRTTQDILHFASFGLYTKRVPESPDNLVQLANERETEAELQFLERVAGEPMPEVRWDPTQIEESLNKLSSLTHSLDNTKKREHAIALVDKIRDLTGDNHLRASCNLTLTRLRPPQELFPAQPEPVQAIISSK